MTRLDFSGMPKSGVSRRSFSGFQDLSLCSDRRGLASNSHLELLVVGAPLRRSHLSLYAAFWVALYLYLGM